MLSKTERDEIRAFYREHVGEDDVDMVKLLDTIDTLEAQLAEARTITCKQCAFRYGAEHTNGSTPRT